MIKPGARKPYRVSKQRVPWTQEEHGRFLEAIDRSVCSKDLSSLPELAIEWCATHQGPS